MCLRALIAAALAALLAGQARADSVSERPESVSVTAYREGGGWRGAEYWNDGEEGLGRSDGLVMVTEVRTIDVPAGRAKISFRGVAEGIIPQTAAVDGLPTAMLERNHDYDLLSPGALIAKSIGRSVRLVRTNDINGEVTEEIAVVRSGPRGVVLDYGDGRVETVNCSGWPERLVFDEIPEGLADRPTLSVVTNAADAGRYQVRLSYLAFGLKWAADYVARIQPNGERLDLTGWITLSNRSGTSFVKAPTQVVAGNVGRENDTAPPPRSTVHRTDACWQMDTTTRVSPEPTPPPFVGGGMVEALIVTAQKREEDIQDVPIAISAFSQEALAGELADYKLYTLPEPTTVAARQTKQVLMLHKTDVPFERLYVHEIGAHHASLQAQPSAVTLRLINTNAGGLGRALPGGRVAVMAPYGDASLLVGEEDFRDVPVGLPFDLEIGWTADVRADQTLIREWHARRNGEAVTRRELKISMANDKAIPATMELRLNADSWRVVSSSHRRSRRYGDITWQIRLKPGERRTMRVVAERAS